MQNKAQATWKIQRRDGETIEVPVRKSSSGRRGPGAVRKAAQRRQELAEQLANRCVERRAERTRGELGYQRDPGGGLAAGGRLLDEVTPSGRPGGDVVFGDSDLTRPRDEQAAKKQRRASYRDVVDGDVWVNGRRVSRDEDAAVAVDLGSVGRLS